MLRRKIEKLSLVFVLAAMMLLGVGAFSSASAAAISSAAAFDDDDDDRRGRGKRGDKGNRGRGARGDSDREARRQQHWSDWNSRRQQRDSDRESRRQQQWSDQNARRQQWESDRRSRQQQQWSDWNSRRQQEMNVRNARRQQEYYNTVRRRENNRRDERRVVYASPGGYWNQMFNGFPGYRVDNRRFEREQNRNLRQQRKAERQYQRSQQRYARNVYRGYSAPAYGNNNDYYYSGQPTSYNGGSTWKSQILPMLIANIFGGGLGTSASNILRSARSVPYGNSYDYRDRRPAGVYQPTYDNYGPSHDNSYNDYDSGQPAFDSGSLLNSLPIAEIIEQYTGENEFVSGLIGSFLTQGYDQGLLAGQAARSNGYAKAQYNDPYAYQNGSCDPYSTSLGENRRYLSEGYEQGYRDALAGNENYDIGQFGESDLVSVLLNGVLSGV